MLSRTFFSIVMATAGLGACSQGPETPSVEGSSNSAATPGVPAELPAVIVAARGGFIPEGIEYDQNDRRFLVGSLTDGTIYELHADGGLTAAVKDPQLRSSVGIEADEPRNRLLVANSDAAVFQGNVQGQARLGVYDLSSGEQIAMVDLAATLPDTSAGSKNFANDVTVSDDGTAYVTDTYAHAIYRVDPTYSASVLYQFRPSGDFMLNGLVYDPSGFLLVVDSSAGDLYKVPVDDPSALSRVRLPEPVPGGDGVVWQSPDRLAIVSNSQNRVVALTSDDGWDSARIVGVAPFADQGTTAAVAGGELYVVHPHFQDQEPPTVERVTFR
jgi:sugar lactone lactonase YvrE